MATLDWPEALVPQSAQLALRKAGVQFASPFNGTPQAVDFVAERWALSATLATISQRNPRGVRSFLNQLSGGINRVRVWDFAGGGQPRGTLRGTPRLSVAAARGDTTLSIKEATAWPNLLRNGSFEIDTNADGLCDLWLAYSAGSPGTITRTRATSGAAHGSNYQQVQASALAAGAGNHAGIYRNQAVLPDTTYTFSAALKVEAGTFTPRMAMTWRDGSSVIINNVFYSPPATASWARYSVSATMPSNAASVDVFVYMQDGGGGLCRLGVDAAQLEIGAGTGTYAGFPTLAADDFLGVGGQIFQAAAAATADDAGSLTLSAVNRVRATIALDAAVTWYRPTVDMMMPAMQAGALVRPGAIEGAGLDLIEVW